MSKDGEHTSNPAAGGGSSGGGNAAPPDPKRAETPDTTPANAGLRFEDPRTTATEGDGGVSSDR